MRQEPAPLRLSAQNHPTSAHTASAQALSPEGGRRAGAWARLRGPGPPEGRQQLDLRPVECEEAGSGAWGGLERRRRASGDADLSHGFVTGSGQGSPIQVCLCARRLARPCAGRRPNLRKPAGATWLPRIPPPMSAETCPGLHQPQIPREMNSETPVKNVRSREPMTDFASSNRLGLSLGHTHLGLLREKGCCFADVAGPDILNSTP